MTDTKSPITRRLRLRYLVWGLIAFVGVVVIAAALAAGRVALAIVAMAFVGMGIPLAYWITRTREELRGEPPSR